MALLNTTQPDAAVAAANQVRQIAQQQFLQLGRSGVAGYNLIWRNPRATPTEVIAALGTDAAAIFQLANLNITTVGSAATIGGATAPAIPSIPVGYTLTFNSDGSATVTQSSSSSSSGS